MARLREVVARFRERAVASRDAAASDAWLAAAEELDAELFKDELSSLREVLSGSVRLESVGVGVLRSFAWPHASYDEAACKSIRHEASDLAGDLRLFGVVGVASQILKQHGVLEVYP